MINRRFNLLIAAALLLQTCAAAASDFAEVSTAMGYVPDAKAKANGGGEHYRFRGAVAHVSILIPAVKENQWYGAYASATYLSNTYTVDDASESLSLRDFGGLWQIAGTTNAVALTIGAGISQAVVEQKEPLSLKYAYSGYYVNAAVRFGLIGNANANVHLRAEANFRTLPTGRDTAVGGEKLLPFTMISYPIYLGAGVRL